MIKAFTMTNRWIYSIWLMCLFTVNTIYGAQVQLSVESAGYPDYLYKDEPINITCKASGYNTVAYVGLVNGTSTAIAANHHGCSKTFSGWNPFGTLNAVPGVATLDTSFCAAAALNSPPFTVTLTDKVTESMKGLNLSCSANADGTNTLSSERLIVSDLRIVPPGNLQLSISGEEPKIVEGKEFTFTCSSSGASPPSVYRYEILWNGEFIANTNKYTPVEADRDGLITLVCNDTVHEVLNVTYPERVGKVMEQKPYYLAVDDEENIATSLNPTGDNTLYCEVSGYPVEEIAYSWSCTGCTSTDRSLVIPAGSDDVETISCTASLASLRAITITWTVTWSESVPTATTTIATTTVEVATTDDAVSDDAVTDGAVVVGGGIAGICIGVVAVIAVL